MEILTTTKINSTPDLVWQVLTDFDSYPLWNPFIKSIKGIKEVGEQLEVIISPQGGKQMVFRPVVKELSECNEFSWKGKVLLPYLFDGLHTFVLQKTKDNKTILVHKEKFTGVLAPIIFPLMRKSTKQGFENMNGALSRRVDGLNKLSTK